MASKVVRFDATPNPNAIKCSLDARISDTPRSYFKPEEARAASDTLAMALFSIPNVTNVLIHTDWITVCKSPDGQWEPIKAAIRAALARIETHGP